MAHKLVLIFVVFLSLLFSFVPVKAEEAVVCSHPGYPFAFQTDDGGIQGVEVDIIHSLVQRYSEDHETQITPRFRLLPFGEILRNLQDDTGQCNLMISRATRTADRCERFFCSSAYARSGKVVIFVRKDATLQNIEELDKPNNTVAVIPGTTYYEVVFPRYFSQAEAYTRDMDAAGTLDGRSDPVLQAVLTGRATAGMGDAAIILPMLTNIGDFRNGLKVLDFADQPEEERWGIIFRAEELRDEFDPYLLALIEDGLRRIWEQHTSSDFADLVMLE